MDENHFLRELGQVERVLHGAIPSSHHRQHLIPEERQRPVAHGAGRDPSSGLSQALFVRKPDPLGVGAGGDDDRGGGHRPSAARANDKGTDLKVHLHHVLREDSGTEALGLLPEIHHHFLARHAFRKARIVLHVGGEHELASRNHGAAPLALEDQRVQLRPGCVDGCGPAGGAGPDDDQGFVISIAHLLGIR
jgi:hypothetical protein